MITFPDSFLRKMSKADRESLGRGGMTAEEALDKFTVKSERDLQKQISSWLRLHDIFFTWSRTDKRTRGYLGTPDFCFCYIDNVKVFGDARPIRRPIALEVKFDSGKLSDIQEKVKSQMERNGWYYHVVRSLNDVRKVVNL